MVINLYFKLVQFCLYADTLFCCNNKINGCSLPKPSPNIAEFCMEMLIYILISNFKALFFKCMFFMKQMFLGVETSGKKFAFT